MMMPKYTKTIYIGFIVCTSKNILYGGIRFECNGDIDVMQRNKDLITS